MGGKVWLRFKGKTLLIHYQQTFENKKFVDITQQCFALLPQVNSPTNNLNFYWKRWDQIQAISLNLFYLISRKICLNFNYIPLWTKSSTPSFREMELTMHFPWEHFRPASITAKSEESMHNGTFEISGSDEIKLQNYRPVHTLLSRLYLDYILILSWFYPDFIQISSR